MAADTELGDTLHELKSTGEEHLYNTCITLSYSFFSMYIFKMVDEIFNNCLFKNCFLKNCLFKNCLFKKNLFKKNYLKIVYLKKIIQKLFI